jgi:hypothetical protein
MSKAKIIQWGAKLLGFGAKAAKTTKKAVKIVPKAKSNKSVAALSKSIDKFKTSDASRKLAFAKAIKADAANAKKIKDAAAANKKAEAAKRALNAVNKKKSLGTKVPAAEVKKVTDASVAAGILAKKTAAAKKLAEKAVAVKKANIAKKAVAGRKIVVAKRTAKVKKAADTKKAAPTTEPTPKVKDNSYSGTNLDTRAGKVAAYAGKKADAIGKGVAGVIKAPVKGARYIYRNPKKAIVPAIIAGIVANTYNQNRKYNAMLKTLEGKNKKTGPKTIFDKDLYKSDTTGQAAYLKKQALKTRNSSPVDSTAYKKAQAHLDSLVLLQNKKNR